MSKQLTVWILQTGEPLHVDSGSPRPMRAMNLANTLIERGHKVVIFSADFSHTNKVHRFGANANIQISELLEYRLITSPGYKGHIGFKRLIDHWVLGKTLKASLAEHEDRPDVAFVGYPPIEAAYVMAVWLKQRKVPFIIDVKDQWPVIFVNALPSIFRPFGALALFPYFYMAKTAMSCADGISSIAQPFLNWGLKFIDRPQNEVDRVVPLSPPQKRNSMEALEDALSFWQREGLINERYKIVFIGTHSDAFDMLPVVQAAKYFANKNADVDFIICGEGPLTLAWQELFAGLTNVAFPGWIDSPKIEFILNHSLAVLVPYRNTEDFKMSIPNKVVDALAFSKPILTGLEGEVKTLVSSNNIGLPYDSDKQRLENCIETLMNDGLLVENMKNNSKVVYASRFEYNNVYQGLADHLEILAQKGKHI